jgi:hypothetical protein
MISSALDMLEYSHVILTGPFRALLRVQALQLSVAAKGFTDGFFQGVRALFNLRRQKNQGVRALLILPQSLPCRRAAIFLLTNVTIANQID